MAAGGGRLRRGAAISTSAAIGEFGQKRCQRPLILQPTGRGCRHSVMARHRQIDRCGPPARQARIRTALGGEAENLIVESFELGMLEKSSRIIALGQQIDGAAQPLIGHGPFGHETRDIRGLPCRAHAPRDPVFRDLVHLARAICNSSAACQGPTTVV